MLRGTESDEDERYITDLSRKLDVPATVERRSVAAYHQKTKLSLEETAREVRYRFFAEVAERENTDTIAVGHTLDDHVETLLMHIIRGTGLTGLCGLQAYTRMMPVDAIRIALIRPLLECTKSETGEYCRQNGVTVRHDVSNKNTGFLRNRIRLELLPALRTYNDRFDEALLKLARSAGESISFLEAEAHHQWQKLAEHDENTVYLSRAKLSSLHPSLQKQLFRMAIEKVVDSLKDIESVHLEEMREFLRKPTGKLLQLPHGLRLYSDYSYLILTAQKSPLPPCPFPFLENSYPLKVPGETIFPGWRVETSIEDAALEVKIPNDYDAAFDLDITGPGLYVRTRKPGDRFRPLGMEHPKKLQDFMVDVKIPGHWRDRIPLLCSGNRIIWVVGWRIDERFKVTEATGKALKVTFRRDNHASHTGA
jgi:tRNA(Ile)-lysidine synthase